MSWATMARRFKPQSIRARLTLWYSGAVTVALIAFAVPVYLLQRDALRDGLDRELDRDVELAEEYLEVDREGQLSWRPTRHAARDGSTDWDTGEPFVFPPWVEVWSADGRRQYLHGPAAELAGSLATPSAPALFSARLPDGSRVRVLDDEEGFAGRQFYIRAVRSEEPLRRELRTLLLVQLLLSPLAIAGAVAGGYLMASRALAPVGEMAERARTITAERLGDRLPVADPNDELGRLATTFNDTLARLERSFAQLRRFTADASHELRTPLTALRSVGEVGLRSEHDTGGYREIIGSMLEEAEDLTELIDALLWLSRADGEMQAPETQPVDIGELTARVVDQLAVLAEEKEQSLEFRAAERVEVLADPLLLRRAFVNLLDNAVKYTPERGRVGVAVSRRDGRACVEFTDTGPGVPEQHRSAIFERFFRSDPARSRYGGGFGLGLAIAQWAVEAHGGHIELDSTAGQGSTFRVILGLYSDD